VVNDGSVQRDSVSSVSLPFNTTASLSDGAVEVQRADGSDVGISVSTSVVNGQSVAVITFSGPDLVNGSLPDGSYTVILHGSLVQDGFGQALAQDGTWSFTRLQGDLDGDGDVDAQEAPTVTGASLNEGEAAGTAVHSITLHFSGVVSADAGAFELAQQGVGPVGLVATTSVVDGTTVVVLTFTGPVLSNGALPDGAYTLTIHGNLIHDGQGMALGQAFTGDRAADFAASDGGTDLVSSFRPVA
jgi:hypothetical protein